MLRPIEQSTNGQNHPRPRKGFLSPKHQRGPTRSGIECDKKQGKYKHSELSKEEQRNDARSTSNVTKSNPISEEGRTLLEDTEKWCDQASLLKECYESRKRERIHEDGSFLHHQKGPITATYTADWFLRVEEYKRKLGDWLKGTSVKSQDQRRMIQATTLSFPSNAWIHKITKGKESNKCDLCKALWIKGNRFTTEADLPEQDLGHIQHTCEALAEAHTAAHHSVTHR